MSDDASSRAPALRYDQRPTDDTPVHTADLPPTPIRDRNIPATAWVEAPADLLALGADLPGTPVAEYKRRIGPWLLWRAGPASGGDARYWAALAADTAHAFTLRLFPDGRAEGRGPERHRPRPLPRLEGRPPRPRGVTAISTTAVGIIPRPAA